MLNPETYSGIVVSCYGNESVCSVADAESEKKSDFELFFSGFSALISPLPIQHLTQEKNRYVGVKKKLLGCCWKKTRTTYVTYD